MSDHGDRSPAREFAALARGSTRLAVVGATGAVGREVLAILADLGVEGGRVRAFASSVDSGPTIRVGSLELPVVALPEDSGEIATALNDVDVVIGAADAVTAARVREPAERVGCVFVDNSSAFRLDPSVPLVVPEVNPEDLDGACTVASPNCSAILLATALEPLRRSFGIERVVVATYQAVSGAGFAAIAELERQSRAVLDGHPVRPSVFPELCAFNVFAHESEVDGDGHNVEERKIVEEIRRIWRAPDARIAPTCVRVPVRRAHSQAITVELGRPALEADVRAALTAGQGIEIVDDRDERRFPTPLRASGGDTVLVGRIRRAADARVEGGGGATRDFALFVCTDQLRKGAARNALQIAARLLAAR
jgi:aspartate-semialdehyde dehydrogenase